MLHNTPLSLSYTHIVPQTIVWKMLIVALTVPFSQFLDIDLLSLLLGIWPHISTGQWTCYMAAHVGTPTAWSLWLHSTGEAHQEHHYRFVTQTPSGMVSAYIGMKVMGDLLLRNQKEENSSRELALGAPGCRVHLHDEKL